jgi:hypothetical protein
VKGGEKRGVMIDGTEIDIRTDTEGFVQSALLFFNIFIIFISLKLSLVLGLKRLV